jgi:hypothetical protein
MEADDDTDSMPRLLSVTEILSGTSPMPPIVPDNQSMSPMTSDPINFTDYTEELGNSLAKAVLPTHLFPFF